MVAMKTLPSLAVFLPVVFLTACKKESENAAPARQVCINVKDYLTNQPVPGASVTIYVEAADGSGTGLNGVSDANGNACIDYIDYIYLRGMEVQAANYERNCGPLIIDPTISLSRQVFMLKRNGLIKFHLVNLPPAPANDKLDVSMHSNINGCSGENYIHLFPGSAADTTVIVTAVSGDNYLNWELHRNFALIDSATYPIWVLLGDTTQVEIDY